MAASAAAAGGNSRRHARTASALAVVLTLATGFILTAFSRAQHLSLAFSAYDVGMHLQALWKLGRLHGLFNTIRGLDYWGDHLWIAYALLAPVYRVWTSPLLVYGYQAFGLAAGGLAVYALARRRLASPAAALVPAILYWCYPGVAYTAQENFHPEAIASTWLLVALWADAARRPRVHWTAIVLALLTKEDIALYLLGFAAYAFVSGERRRGVVLATVSVAYFAFAMKVLLPWLNGVGFFRASGGYWFSTWASAFAKPSFYLEVARRPVAAQYVWDLLWPLAFLPLAHPLTLLLLAGPAFVVNNVAGAYLVSVHYHYLYGIIPGLFAATVETLATVEWLTRRRLLVWAAVLGLVLVPTLHRQWTERRTPESYAGMARALHPKDSPKLAKLRRIVAEVPPGAVVAASHDLVPFLADRDAIYMFPNPWRPTYWGIAGENPPSPDAIDTLVIHRFATHGRLNQLARRIVDDGWDVLWSDRDVLYARRELTPPSEDAATP